MFSAGNLREWRGRFFRPVGWPCRPRCTLAELYLQLQRGESVSLHFFRKAKPLPMDNLRKSGVEREPNVTRESMSWPTLFWKFRPYPSMLTRRMLLAASGAAFLRGFAPPPNRYLRLRANGTAWPPRATSSRVVWAGGRRISS